MQIGKALFWFALVSGFLFLVPSLEAGASVGEFGLGSQGYLGKPSPSSGQGMSYSVFEAEGALEFSERPFSGRAELSSAVAINRVRYFHLDLPEAYLATTFGSSGVSATSGRRREDWSRLDQYWQQGLWQPRTRWDFLKEKQVGLTGVFASYESSNFRVVALGSPVFVPEQPPCTLVDGKFLADSPWCVPAQENITIGPSTSPINYQINSPSTRDLTFQPSGALLARVGPSKGEAGWFLSGAMGFKPMNQLLVGMKTKYLAADREYKVDLYPRVVYHQIASADLGYEAGPYGLAVSGLYERPIRDQTPSDWTTGEVREAYALSPTLRVRAFRTGEINLGYLKQWGGVAPDRGPFSEGLGSYFEYRMKYGEALKLGLTAPLANERLRWSTEITNDFGIRGSVLSTELAYEPAERWRLRFGADFLSVRSSDDEVLASNQPNFVYRYRNKDRIYGGVRYVF